jgi:hypothetical protein
MMLETLPPTCGQTSMAIASFSIVTGCIVAPRQPKSQLPPWFLKQLSAVAPA